MTTPPMRPLPRLRYDEMTEAQRELYDAITNGPRKTVEPTGVLDLTDGRGNVVGMAHVFLSPTMGDAFQRLGQLSAFTTI